MRRCWRILVVIFGFTVVCGCATSISQSRLENGQYPAPFEVPVRGKITVLDFWASWCEPCKKAMPKLERLWNDVDRAHVMVVGVTSDETRDDAFGFLKEVAAVTEVTFPMIWDSDGTVQNVYGINTFPAIVLLDANGRIVWSAGGLQNPKEKGVREDELLEKLGTEIDKLLSK